MKPDAPENQADAAGLRYTSASSLPIRRRRCGRGFVYIDETGHRLTDPEALARIRALAIPPNYSGVRISADPDAHLQATGVDDAGRTQYRYHPGWEIAREEQKLDRLALLSASISRIRARVARDLARDDTSRNRVVAAVVLLIDKTHIRIGSEDYVHSGRSRGAATLLKRQVTLCGDEVHLSFRGKGGQRIDCSVRSGALARTVRALKELPGRRLFQYRDHSGKLRRVSSADVNAYLKEAADAPVTAKDFRGLAANAAACERLVRLEPAQRESQRKRQVATVIREVATMLGNTPAVARKSYVHERVVDAFNCGDLARLSTDATAKGRQRQCEALVDAILGRERDLG